MEQMSLNLPGVSTSSPAGRRARTCRSPESGRAWRKAAEPAAPLPSTLRDFVVSYNLDGSYGRTCREYLPATEGATSRTLSARLGNAGILLPTGLWTLNGCEWTGCPEQFRNGDAEFGSSVCGLSDILEPVGEHLRRYCLSLKACAGILRRAASRGKDLPARLKAALLAQIARIRRTQTAGR